VKREMGVGGVIRRCDAMFMIVTISERPCESRNQSRSQSQPWSGAARVPPQWQQEGVWVFRGNKKSGNEIRGWGRGRGYTEACGA